MTPTAVQQFKVLTETLAKLRFRDWRFEAAELEGNVYYLVLRPRWDPHLRETEMIESKPHFLGQTSGRFEIAQSVLGSIRSILIFEAEREFTWDGIAAFARTG
jgi:hypothetical protein